VSFATSKMALHGTNPWVIEGLPGLAQISPPPFDLSFSMIPSGVPSHSLAALGLRIFYIVDQKRVESTVVGWSRQPDVLATEPVCHSIDQIAAAGREVAYVESWPIGMPFEASGCGLPTSVAWTVQFVDLTGGAPRIVAAGVTDGGAGRSGLPPVHLGLSNSVYAFERSAANAHLPGQPAGPTSTGAGAAVETIEVHSVDDGSLLLTTQSDEPVAELMVGGTSLAVLEASAGNPAAGYRLQVADLGDPRLHTVADRTSAAAISQDGSYLAWDVEGGGAGTGVAMQNLASGQTVVVPARSAASTPGPLDPAVSSTSRGPIVAWLATATGGSVYPAFRTPANGSGTAIASVQVTAWVSLQGSVLIWAAAARDASLGVAFAFDLATAQAGT
jgi:hypothetical protein